MANTYVNVKINLGADTKVSIAQAIAAFQKEAGNGRLELNVLQNLLNGMAGGAYDASFKVAIGTDEATGGATAGASVTYTDVN